MSFSHTSRNLPLFLSLWLIPCFGISLTPLSQEGDGGRVRRGTPGRWSASRYAPTVLHPAGVGCVCKASQPPHSPPTQPGTASNGIRSRKRAPQQQGALVGAAQRPRPAIPGQQEQWGALRSHGARGITRIGRARAADSARAWCASHLARTSGCTRPFRTGLHVHIACMLATHGESSIPH